MAPSDNSPVVEYQEDMFKDLCQSIGAMRPSIKHHERSNTPIYQVSVDLFQGLIPKSSIGIVELPYLMAIKGGIPKSEVLKWKGCPSAIVLDQSLNIYFDEIKSARRLLTTIGVGGLFLKAETNEILTKCLKVLSKLSGYSTDLKIDKEILDLDRLSNHDICVLTMLVHLIFSYGSMMRFIIRKDYDGKPSSYLVFNGLSVTNVILPRHLAILQEFMHVDETHLVPQVTNYNCPF